MKYKIDITFLFHTLFKVQMSVSLSELHTSVQRSKELAKLVVKQSKELCKMMIGIHTKGTLLKKLEDICLINPDFETPDYILYINQPVLKIDAEYIYYSQRTDWPSEWTPYRSKYRRGIATKYIYYYTMFNQEIMNDVYPDESISTLKKCTKVVYIDQFDKNFGKVLIPIPSVDVQKKIISFCNEKMKIVDSVASDLEPDF